LCRCLHERNRIGEGRYADGIEPFDRLLGAHLARGRIAGRSVWNSPTSNAARFDLVEGPRSSMLQDVAAAWRRFYAALIPTG
jgi:hypothetical protein